MLLLPGFAPDKGMHVVSIARLEDGRLQCEPVIVPEDVINRCIHSRGIRWYTDAWNQVHISELQPGELPPEVNGLPVISPLTPPGQTIARLERPRLPAATAPVAIPLNRASVPGEQTGTQRPAEIRSVRGIEKATELRKGRKSAPVPAADRTTRQTAVNTNVAQRPRLSLDVIYSAVSNSSKAPPTPSTKVPPRSAGGAVTSQAVKAEEPDTGNGYIEGKARPRYKKLQVPKGWQPFYNLTPAHNVLEEQDFMHTFAAHPIKPDGSRDIKYMADNIEHTVTLPPSTYGRSLHDILPADTPRKFWMHITRHPLIWDGLHDNVKTSNDLPNRESIEWHKSVRSVGLHLLHDFPADERPTYSMHLLIRTAILGSPYQTLNTNDLRVLLMAKYPYFRTHFSDYWYNQISNVHSRQEYASWLGSHRMLSGAQSKYWTVLDAPALDIPDDYKFPAIRLIRVKDAKGAERLAIDSSTSGERKTEKVILDRAPVVVPEPPVPVERPKKTTMKKAMRVTGKRRLTPASPPPETVISTDGADGLSPESEDDFSIADPNDIDIDLGPLEDEGDSNPPSPFWQALLASSEPEYPGSSAV